MNILHALYNKVFKSNAKQWVIINFDGQEIKKKVSENFVFEGNGRIFLLLNPGVNVLIRGSFTGLIIGRGNNEVIFEGTFKGLVSSFFTTFRKVCSIEGRLYTDKILVEKGCDFSPIVSKGILQELYPELNFQDIDMFQNKVVIRLFKEVML